MLSHGFLSVLLCHYNTVQRTFSPIYGCKVSRTHGGVIVSTEDHPLRVAPVTLFTSRLRFGLRLQTAFPLNSVIILRMLCNITYGRRSDNYAFITLSDFTCKCHFFYLSFFFEQQKSEGLSSLSPCYVVVISQSAAARTTSHLAASLTVTLSTVLESREARRF